MMSSRKDEETVSKAKERVQKAHDRYMKTVARGQRRLHKATIEIEGDISRARAKFEARATLLATIEGRRKKKAETEVSATEAADLVAEHERYRPTVKVPIRTR